MRTPGGFRWRFRTWMMNIPGRLHPNKNPVDMSNLGSKQQSAKWEMLRRSGLGIQSSIRGGNGGEALSQKNSHPFPNCLAFGFQARRCSKRICRIRRCLKFYESNIDCTCGKDVNSLFSRMCFYQQHPLQHKTWYTDASETSPNSLVNIKVWP